MSISTKSPVRKDFRFVGFDEQNALLSLSDLTEFGVLSKINRSKIQRIIESQNFPLLMLFYAEKRGKFSWFCQ